MRVIYGKLNRPDKTHLLIIRGFDRDSWEYFQKHIIKYPTWGIVVCEEAGITREDTDLVSVDNAIHKFLDGWQHLSDDEVIRNVLNIFPEYDDDLDPEVSPSPYERLREATSKASEAMGSFEEAAKEYLRPPVYSPSIRDDRMPVKIISNEVKINSLEYERLLEHSGPSTAVSKLPKELEYRIKRAVLENLLENDVFWDIQVVEEYDTSYPGTTLRVQTRLAVAPLADVAREREISRPHVYPEVAKDYFGKDYVGKYSFGVDLGHWSDRLTALNMEATAKAFGIDLRKDSKE